jgi:hypothetical protein
MLKVGIRAANLPTQEEGMILYEHLMRHYGNHTQEEIKMAFDLAITGQLGVDSTPYESFDCRYISRILNAYRVWAQEVYQQHRQVLELAPPRAFVERSWREEVQRELNAFYSGSFNYKLVISDLYDQLVFDGYLNAFAYEAFLEGAKAHLLHAGQLEITTIKNEWTDENVDAGKYKSVQSLEIKLSEYRSGKRDNEIRLLAKQLTVRHYFNYLQVQEIKTLYIKE